MKVARFVGLFSLLVSTIVLAQSNPVPLINNPLVPASVAPGGPSFTLTVNGTGFVSGATVDWNGLPLTTTFVSGSRLTATVPAANIATASTASITVVNPAPGLRTSNVAYLTITPPRTTLSFSEALPLSSNAYTVAAADFNRDGKLDLVAAYGGNSITVFQGNGDGTFQAGRSFGAGNGTTFLVVGDLNNDGFVDLAVTALDVYSISILLGNGDGTFQHFISLPPFTFQPQSLALGDFNGDGNTDMAFCGGNSSAVSIILGNGDGTFQPISQYTSTHVSAVLVGDFNLDGKLDIAAGGGNVNSVSVLLGNGDGTFPAYQSYATGVGSESLITADFNGDGKLDLATANYNNAEGGVVSILLGNGDGTFATAQNYNTDGVAAWPLTAGDFNGDGKLDIAVGTEVYNFLGIYATSVLLGNGDGTFQPHLDYAGEPFEPSSLVAGDLNNDGQLDLANIAVTVLLQDNGTVMLLSATQLRFATQMVGGVSQPQAVQVTNGGSSPVAISSVATTTNSRAGGIFNFEQLNNCPSQLQPAASCTVNVYFTPEQQGSLSGYLAVFDSGGGSPQVVKLSGTGTVMQISPKSIDFGQQQVGTSSPPKNIKVTNRGGKTIKISGITITGANATDFAEVNACGGTLGPGASCTIAVVFTPTQVGMRTAAVRISDTGGGSPQKVALKGTGT